MNTCKQCGRDFVYNAERGYAADLCGPLCDGVFSQRDKINAAWKEVDRLNRKVQRLKDAIWPGLPEWTPTPEHPQQDFYEAVAESLHAAQRKVNSDDH